MARIKSANEQDMSGLDNALRAPVYIQQQKTPPDARDIGVNKSPAPKRDMGSATVVAPETPAPSAPYVPPNMTNTINDLYKAQERAKMSSLESARQKALGALDQQQATIAPMYYDKRNQLASQNQQQARNFAEFMAQRGGVRAGANAQVEIARGNQLQGNMNALNMQEQQAMDQIARNRAQTNQDYINLGEQASSDLNALRLQQLLDQNRYDQGQALQIAGLMGSLNGQRTLQGQQYDNSVQQQALQNKYTEAGLTGNYNGARTLQGQQFDNSLKQQDFQNEIATSGITGNYNGQRTLQGQTFDLNKQQQERSDFINSIKGRGDSFDYMQAINNVNSDGDPTNDWQLGPLMQARNEKIQAKKADDRTQAELDFNKAFKMWSQAPANDYVASILNVPKGSRSQDYNVGQANIAQSNASGSAALMNANTNSQELAWKMNPNNPNNQKETKIDKESIINSNFGSDYATLKAMSWYDADKALKDPDRVKKAISLYGPDGYAKLYNAVMADAIESESKSNNPRYSAMSIPK